MRIIHKSYQDMNKKKRAKLGLETKTFIAKQCERAWRGEKQYVKSNVKISCCLADSNCILLPMSNSVKRMRNMMKVSSFNSFLPIEIQNFMTKPFWPFR